MFLRINSPSVLLNYDVSSSLSLLYFSSSTSFSLYLSLIKISSISFGKSSLTHHMFAFWSLRDLLCLEVHNLLPSIFSRYLQKNSPSCYVLLISKAKELKYQQLCFHSDVCCNISQTKLYPHLFFAYQRYDIQILPVLSKRHPVYSSHFQVLQTCFGIWNCSGVF